MEIHAQFLIIPKNKMLPAHHLWAGSLHFPPRDGRRQVRPEKSEATRPIPWYQDQAGYAPLRSRCCCWWARRWHIIAIIGLHCFSEIGTLSQNRYWFCRRKLAQLSYLGVSPFCIRSQGQVSLPHRAKFDLFLSELGSAQFAKVTVKWIYGMEFPQQWGKSISESGINNIGWRG